MGIAAGVRPASSSTRKPNAAGGNILMPEPPITIVEADPEMMARVLPLLNDIQAKHAQTAAGFTLFALQAETSPSAPPANAGTSGKPVGLLAVEIRNLPEPLAGITEAYINIIEVDELLRRRSIASRMLGMAAVRARERGASQLRAFTSHDKPAALAMWRRLGFCLCPATECFNGEEVRGFYAVMRV